jgi:hypothetical protein
VYTHNKTKINFAKTKRIDPKTNIELFQSILNVLSRLREGSRLDTIKHSLGWGLVWVWDGGDLHVVAARWKTSARDAEPGTTVLVRKNSHFESFLATNQRVLPPKVEVSIAVREYFGLPQTIARPNAKTQRRSHFTDLVLFL